MTSKREINRQLNRLFALSGARECADEGWAEIRAALATAASDDHAERVVSAWLREHRWLPTPAEIYALIERIPAVESTTAPDRKCAACQGSGFRKIHLLVSYVRHPNGAMKDREETELEPANVERLVRQVDGRSQIVTDAVRACRCEYGVALARARLLSEAAREERAHKRGGRAAAQ